MYSIPFAGSPGVSGESAVVRSRTMPCELGDVACAQVLVTSRDLLSGVARAFAEVSRAVPSGTRPSLRRSGGRTVLPQLPPPSLALDSANLS